MQLGAELPLLQEDAARREAAGTEPHFQCRAFFIGKADEEFTLGGHAHRRSPFARATTYRGRIVCGSSLIIINTECPLRHGNLLLHSTIRATLQKHHSRPN